MKIRCSSLPRIAACPGSHRACEGLESKDSAQSIAGTAGHKALENYYKQYRAEERKPIDAFLDGLDDMIAGRCRWYADTIDGLIEEHGGAEFIYTELETALRFFADDMLTGHIDLVVVCKDKVCLIVDYKFNWLEVPRAAQNLQLMGYAVLVSGFVSLGDDAVIHAVLTAGGNDEPFTAVKYNAWDIIKAETHLIKNVIAQAKDAYAPRIPSDEACKYCPAKCSTRCPETLNKLSVDGCQLPVGMIEESYLPENKEDILKLWRDTELVKSLCVRYQERVKDAVRANPEKYEGFFTLQNAGSTRKVQDAQKAYQTIVEDNGLLPAAEFLALVNLPIGKLETAVKPVLIDKGFKAKDVKATVEQLLGDNLTHEPKEPVVKAVGK